MINKNLIFVVGGMTLEI